MTTVRLRRGVPGHLRDAGQDHIRAHVGPERPEAVRRPPAHDPVVLVPEAGLELPADRLVERVVQALDEAVGIVDATGLVREQVVVEVVRRDAGVSDEDALHPCR